jgi:hypothetical protein
MPISYGVRTYSVPGDGNRVLVVLGEAHLKLGEASALGKEITKEFELRGVETFQRRQVALGVLLGFLIHFPRLVLRQLSFGLVRDSTIVDARALPDGVTVELEKTDRVPLSLHVASVYMSCFFLVAAAQLALAGVQSVAGEPGGLIGTLTPWLTLVTLVFELHFLLIVPAYILRRHSWSWLVHPAVGIVAARDTLMAEGTVRMLRHHPDPQTALVIMGRAHLPGFERELIEKHAFRRMRF